MKISDLHEFKQHCNVTYHAQAHVTDYVTGFDISYSTHKKFMCRFVQLNVLTLYHSSPNLQPYTLDVRLCYGAFEPVGKIIVNSQYRTDNTVHLAIDFSNKSMMPVLLTTLGTINTQKILPQIDLAEPNVVIVSSSKNVIVPTVTVGNSQLTLAAPIPTSEPIAVLYNSKLVITVQHSNLIEIDGETETMSVSKTIEIPLGITLDELLCMQYTAHPHRVNAEVAL